MTSATYDLDGLGGNRGPLDEFYEFLVLREWLARRHDEHERGQIGGDVVAFLLPSEDSVEPHRMEVLCVKGDNLLADVGMVAEEMRVMKQNELAAIVDSATWQLKADADR